MKVIDLLNKIANGEEVPKEIKFCDKFRDEKIEYIFDKGQSDYERVDKLEYLFNDHFMTEWLNDEVEIIEEDKEIEELTLMFPCDKFDAEIGGLVAIYNANFGDIKQKMNKIIKGLNELKKGK